MLWKGFSGWGSGGQGRVRGGIILWIKATNVDDTMSLDSECYSLILFFDAVWISFPSIPT